MSGISEPTIKRLFALSGDECAFPQCSNPMVDPSGTIGQMCHIKGEKPGAARYDASQTDKQRNSFDNLILMCPFHHRVIDIKPELYTVDNLLLVKTVHEQANSKRARPSEAEANQFLQGVAAGETERAAPTYSPEQLSDADKIFIDFLDRHSGAPTGWVAAGQELKSLTAGLSGVALTNLENFLHAYIGTADAPTLFGGRSSVLTALNAWLADPTDPYALLVAPMGRGKSALVTQWALTVAKESRAYVAFLPVNLRFGTARRNTALSLLGARLHHLALPNRQVPDHVDTEYWLSLIAECLRAFRPEGQPLLVVLDGVDEAVGWKPEEIALPGIVVPGLKVLISTRPRPGHDDRTPPVWLNADARRIELPPLSLAEVQQIVRQEVDRTSSGMNPDRLVEVLFPLSGGDPLVLKLYLDLLADPDATGQLSLASLRKSKPGISGFFEREWGLLEQQWAEESRDPREKPVASALLHALTYARGPLSKGDLATLTQVDGGTSLLVGPALGSLRRLVIGQETPGYVFSHPLWNHYFQDSQFTLADRRDWEDRLGAYCRDVVRGLVAGDLQPDDVPIYVLENHAIQLDESVANPSELLDLISKEWMVAWEGHSGSYDGFDDDLLRAWHAAERFGAKVVARGLSQRHELEQALAGQIRLALISASVRGRVGGVPSHLVAQLVEDRQWSVLQGIAYATAMPSDARRKDALCLLAQTGQPMPFEPAKEACGGIVDPCMQVGAIACLLPKTEGNAWELDQWADYGLRLTGEIANEGDRAEALIALVPVLPDTLLDRAFALSESIRQEANRLRVLAELAARTSGKAKLRLVNEALMILEHFDGGVRAYLLQFLPGVLTASTLPKAFRLAKDIHDPKDRAGGLLLLVPWLPKALRSQAIASIGETTEQIDVDDRIEIIIELLDWVSDADLPKWLDRLARDANDSEGGGSYAHAVTTLARYFLANGQVDEALRLVEEALNLPVSKATALKQLAAEASGADLPRIVEAAESAAASYDSPQHEAREFAELAALAPEPLQVALRERAVEAARKVPAGRSRASSLSQIAHVFPEAERAELLREALETALGIGHSWHYDSALAFCELLPIAEADQRPRIIGKVLNVLPRFEWPLPRADVHAKLLPYCNEETQRNQLAEEGLAALNAAVVEAPPLSNRYATWQWTNGFQTIAEGLLPHLTRPLLQEALALARRLPNPGLSGEMLVAIALRLDAETRAAVTDEALAIADALEYERGRAHLYGMLYGEVVPQRRDGLISAIAELDDPFARAYGYVSCVKHASEDFRSDIIPMALEAINAIDAPRERYDLLILLANALPPEEQGAIYRQASKAAALVSRAWEQLHLLKEVVMHLDGTEKSAAVANIVKVARSIQATTGNGRALSLVTCWLIELGLAGVAAPLVLEIEDAQERAQAKVCIDARSQEAFDIDQALIVANALGDNGARMELLVTIAERAPAERRRECLELAVQATLALPKDKDREQFLRLLLPVIALLTEEERYTVLSRALRTMGNGDRTRLLSGVLPLVPAFIQVTGPSAVLAVTDAISETDTWFSLQQ